MEYNEFLETKFVKDEPSGFDVDKTALNPLLMDYQKDLVAWALKRGRAALFCDCGLGKSFMQLEWAHHIPGNVLIVAPLAVGPQTVKEAVKFNIGGVTFNQDGGVTSKITVTNYESLHKFNPSDFKGIVLDESSILKNETGKYRNELIETWGKVSYRLACTATPSPNDLMEIGNHCEFLGVASMSNMIAKYFIHDSGDLKQACRLKKHAAEEFWKWVAQWAVMMRDPKELGYCVDGFNLPPLNVHQINVKTENTGPYLFQMAAETLQERLQARRETIEERAINCAELIKSKGGTWVVWCNLNAEAEALRKLLPQAVEVKGSDKPADKVDRLSRFSDGQIKVLITKPKIAAMGMNWQHCNQVAFLGLSDSFEQYYQAVRRCWRFGQKKPVDAYLITADREGNVVENIKRKEEQHNKMIEEMSKHMEEYTKAELKQTSKQSDDYNTDCVKGKNYTAYLGDCVDVVASLPDESIHYSIFSPPFSSLYMFSDTHRDMSNVTDYSQFFGHFSYLINDLHRVMKSGRLVSIHCCNLPKSKNHDGVIGIYDFRGDIIRAFESAGFVFHSEVVIWKDPVVAMQRTKAIGLLHKQVVKDSAMSRQGIPDYLVTMRKIGDNKEPISGIFKQFNGGDISPQEFKDESYREFRAHGWEDDQIITDTNNNYEIIKESDCDYHFEKRHSIDIWQRYASPVWMDIRQGDVLNYREGKDTNDEKHITPLQLGVIERGLDLWTNPGDTVLSPFMGIGSEGHVSLLKGRKFIGAELKESYYKQAVKNLQYAEDEASSGTIPGLAELMEA